MLAHCVLSFYLRSQGNTFISNFGGYFAVAPGETSFLKTGPEMEPHSLNSVLGTTDILEI